MIRNAAAIVLLAAASGAIWYGYDQLSVLRQTFWWDYRYLVLLVGAVLILSLAEYIAGKFPDDSDH